MTCNAEDYDELANNVLQMSTMGKHEITQMGTNALNLYTRDFSRNLLLNRVEQLFYNMINQ